MVNPINLNESSPADPARAPARVIQVHATVGKARIRRRHWGVLLSFLTLVALPFAAVAIYIGTYATPQFTSTSGFTVRQTETTGAADFLGGISQLAVGPASVDGDILFEFIASQPLLERLQERIDLRGHFSAPHDSDPVFALSPDATTEQFVDHWQRIVRTSYNQSNGLMELRVNAFSPRMAQALNEAIIAEGQELVNSLNASARADAMRFAEADLAIAAARLNRAREALSAFRTRTQIVDPGTDIQGRLGVLNNLQQRLAELLIENDLLIENTADGNDPRLLQTGQRIEVIRTRIAEERENFNRFDSGGATRDYSALITEFESLIAERELAEQGYGRALAALDVARTYAARQRRYLAVYIEPTFPETAQFPRIGVVLAQVGLFLLIGWSILVLVAYSIRDRQ